MGALKWAAPHGERRMLDSLFLGTKSLEASAQGSWRRANRALARLRQTQRMDADAGAYLNRARRISQAAQAARRDGCGTLGITHYITRQ
jgi:hypothetical protein